jgi:hypothetical protein
MSDLERIGEHVDELLQRIGMPAAPSLAALAEEWDEAAGDPWAGAATPVGLDAGVLVVEVVDGAHASLLRYQTGALIDRLSERIGEGVVSAVRIRVRPAKKGR